MNFQTVVPHMRIEAFAPGRVNLIGEHTDYNGGLVLPFALQQGIKLTSHWANSCSSGASQENSRIAMFVESAPQGTQLLRAHLTGSQFQQLLEESRSQSLAALAALGRTPAAAPLKGALPYLAGAATLFLTGGKFEAQQLAQAWEKLELTLHIKVTSNLPAGAGLSSSAALTMSFLFLLQAALAGQYSLKELCEIGMEVEHYYAGTKCGMMDQLAVSLAEEDCYLQVHFNAPAAHSSIDHTLIKAHGDFSCYSGIVFHTGVAHSLASSEYNVRRQQCSTALGKLNQLTGIEAKTLGEYFFAHWDNLARATATAGLTKEQAASTEAQQKLAEALTFALKDKEAAFRASHAIAENARVTCAVKALCEGNLLKLDEMMQASHASLRDHYAVSCEELNTACELLREAAFALQKAYPTNGQPPIIGPRMTGGGFGGSVIALVHQNILPAITRFFASSENPYTLKTGKIPRLLSAKPSSGAHLRFL